MSEAKARELLSELIAAWDAYFADRDNTAPTWARLDRARDAARAYLAAVPAPPAEPSIDAIDECIGLVAGELHDEGRARAAWDQLRALIAAPAGEPVAQNNGRVVATQGCDEPQIRTLRSAHPHEPVAQQPPPLDADARDDMNMAVQFAPQPEAPTLADDLVARLIGVADQLHDFRAERIEQRNVMAADARQAAARIESDAKIIAASRERERLYAELIYAVASKFPGETRHETALRYIRNAERGSDHQCAKAAAIPDSAASPRGGENADRV